MRSSQKFSPSSLCALVKPTFPLKSGALLLFGRRISPGHLVGLRSLGPLTPSQPEEIAFLSYAVSEVLVGHSLTRLTSLPGFSVILRSVAAVLEAHCQICKLLESWCRGPERSVLTNPPCDSDSRLYFKNDRSTMHSITQSFERKNLGNFCF